MPKWAEVIRPPPRERLKKAASAFDDADWPVGEFVASQPKQKKERPLLSSCSIAAATLLELAVFVPLSGRERTEQAVGSSALPPVRDCKERVRPRPRPGWRSYTFCVVAARRGDVVMDRLPLFFIGRSLLCLPLLPMLDSAAAALINLCTFMDSCRPIPYCAFLDCLVSVVCIAPLFFLTENFLAARRHGPK